ncbi:hypothetical protein [Enterococcus sp. BWR-S5]|uniref:hypothetical protein n=1 Tax=Enterococcus sp. BWR-S5 TaxID=2787714 RepID=UPI001924FD55|nr:hypothetical protein [Enterococcus sp. BWR-S5]MBL1224652.1 hypothetical protein [Enterococcus sp. BWR-S5]
MKRGIAAVSVLLMVLFLHTGCSSSMTEEIEVSKNKIASFYKAVGAKELVHTELTYKAGEISEDELNEYMDYLKEEEEFILANSPVTEQDQTTVKLEKKLEDLVVTVMIVYQTDMTGEVTMIYSSDEYKK